MKATKQERIAQLTADVAELCKTETNPDEGTTLYEWLYEGSFDGTESLQSLADEWDEIEQENN